MHIDDTLNMLAEIADDVILPRFRVLEDGDITENHLVNSSRSPTMRRNYGSRHV